MEKDFPPVGSSSKLMQRSMVDLPPPEGPMTVITFALVDFKGNILQNLVFTVSSFAGAERLK
jgi:hypothetical protein